MLTVWKFEVPAVEEFYLSMRLNAKFLHVQKQFGFPQMWFAVNSESPVERRDFYITGTGHPVPDDASYLGTWLSGDFVWSLWGKIA